VLVSRPAGLTRRVNERTIQNDANGYLGEAAVLQGRGRRVYAEDYSQLDWDSIDPSFFSRDFPEPITPSHYVIWDEEFIPPPPEDIEAAKQARRGRVIEMIQESRNGQLIIGDLQVASPCVDEAGERIRIKPEGYVETRGMNAEEKALADKQQAFSENPPAFWELLYKTLGDLWHGNDIPTTITCGYLAFKKLQKEAKDGGYDDLKFCLKIPVLMSRSMKLRQVKFENSNFPGDPKYNRVIEMPDEAYL
jgi:hypothetical protein